MFQMLWSWPWFVAARDAADALVLEDGGHEDGLDLLLHQLRHALVDPDGDVGEHAAVLREVEVPQALLDLEAIV